MATGDSNVKTQKIAPYPFPITIQKDGKFISEKVLKLGQTGAIIEAEGFIYSVGMSFPVSFEIPVFKSQLSLTAKVVKTYDRALVKEKAVQRLAELLFLNPTSEQTMQIQKFLIKIGQVKS